MAENYVLLSIYQGTNKREPIVIVVRINRPFEGLHNSNLHTRQDW